MKGLLFAAACAAAARIPICILSLESTDEDRLAGCLLARLMPKSSCCFSSLHTRTKDQNNNKMDFWLQQEFFT